MAHPIDVARDSVDAFNASDWNRLRELHTADYVDDEVATGRLLEGFEASLEAARGWKRAFSDANGTVTGAYGDGPVAVLEITWRGTHDGPLETPDGEMPASGRSVEIRACQVFEVEAGRIKSSRHYFDMVAMIAQIGVGAEAQHARA